MTRSSGAASSTTVYTPYQPRDRPGHLAGAIYEYQSVICRLTGLYASNVSLYDGGTALFEAAIMAVCKTGRKRLVI